MHFSVKLLVSVSLLLILGFQSQGHAELRCDQVWESPINSQKLLWRYDLNQFANDTFVSLIWNIESKELFGGASAGAYFKDNQAPLFQVTRRRGHFFLYSKTNRSIPSTLFRGGGFYIRPHHVDVTIFSRGMNPAELIEPELQAPFAQAVSNWTGRKAILIDSGKIFEPQK